MSNEEALSVFKQLYALLQQARNNETKFRLHLAATFSPSDVTIWGDEGEKLEGVLDTLDKMAKQTIRLEVQLGRLQALNNVERQDEAHAAAQSATSFTEHAGITNKDSN